MKDNDLSGQAVEEKPNTEVQKTQPKMIKNPLPGPTPHTNREAVDYDYEVPEDKMHYDIEDISRNYYDI